MAIDLTGIEGLTPEQAAAITAAHDSDVTGLKDNRDKWKQENDAFKLSAADQAAQVDEARKVAASAEEARLKAVGDTDGLRAHFEKQLADQTALLTTQTETAKNALLQRDTATAKSVILANVDANFVDFADAMLNQALTITHDENGNAVQSFKVGGVEVAKNTDEFLSWAKDNKSWQAVLKGVESQGTGAQQQPQGGTDSTSQSYATQRYLASIK